MTFYQILKQIYEILPSQNNNQRKLTFQKYRNYIWYLIFKMFPNKVISNEKPNVPDLFSTFHSTVDFIRKRRPTQNQDERSKGRSQNS